MKRFLLSSVIALTFTATTATAFADEPAAETPAAPTTAAPAPPPPPPAATTAAAPTPPPPAPKPVFVAPTVAPTTAQPPKVAAAPSPPPPPAAPEPVAAQAPAPAPAPSGTPLHIAQTTSSSQPLTLAPPTEGLGWGYKLLAVAAIGGAVALYLKKKKGLGFKLPGEVVPSKIDILGKSSVGVRSQLIVVEVEGTRLLVGMTPTSISTLAVLQTPDDDVQPASSRTPQLTTVSALASLTERADRAEQDAFRPATLNDRVRSLLGSDEPISPPRLTSVGGPKPAPKPRARTTRAPAARPKVASNESREIAGQARGLLLSDDEDS